MKKMSDSHLQHLRDLLDEREKALRSDVEREVKQQDSYSEVASEVPDPGDSSFADLSVDINNASVNRDVAELNAIDAARKRMEAGAYGECIDCGLEIPYERLKAQPTAERCAPCQSMYEKTHAEVSKGASM